MSKKQSGKEEEKSIYVPTKDQDDLVCNEKAYKQIFTLNLELPSQSICVYNKNIIFCRMADMSYQNSVLSIIPIEDFASEKIDAMSEFKVDFYVMRISVFNDYLVLLGDTELALFKNNKVWKFCNKQNYSFGCGLTINNNNNNNILVGTEDGNILSLDEKLEVKEIQNAHTGRIDSIKTFDGNIFSASSDGTISRNAILLFKNDVDVNGIDICQNILVFGDENGTIGILNGTKCYKIVGWHKSAIENIKFNCTANNNELVFCACSEEQVSIWNLSFENSANIVFDSNIELTKISNTITEIIEITSPDEFISFVHQGHKFYKDFDFEGNIIFTTAEQGLCMFEPISEEIDDISESSSSSYE